MSAAVAPWLQRLGLTVPIVQAPMAGVSTPAMAAAVSAAGGLGSLAVGAMTVAQATATIAEARDRGAVALNVNVFAHAPATADPAKEAAWSERLRPQFARFGAEPPATLREIYRSFLVDDRLCALLVAARPTVVSFHFGLPRPDQAAALREAGIVLFATATNAGEARAIAAAGLDAIVAQGFEAGGHRGMFAPDAEDDGLGTSALTRRLVGATPLPVIAAGGLMDGGDIAGVLALGAAAAQLGTAFVATDESAADAAFRQRLLGPDASDTTMTRVISGRPARGLAGAFSRWGESIAAADIPDYPIAYDAGKALHAAAIRAGEPGYGAHWAGQGAARIRALPTAQLMQRLIAETGRAKR